MKELTPIDPNIPLLRSVIYARSQPEYFPLPANRTPDGEVITCWKPNWHARLALLFGADFYITMLTFNNPLTPIRVSVDKPVYYTGKKSFSERFLSFKELFEGILRR